MITTRSLVEFFGQTVTKDDSVSRTYQAAASNFGLFVEANGLDATHLSETDIFNWIISMWASGIKPSTSVLYHDILSSLYSSAYREGLIQQKPNFTSTRKALQGSELRLFPDIRKTAERTRIFFRKQSAETPEARMYEDILRLTLIEPHTSTADAAALTRDSHLANAQEIADKYCDARRKYIFPLKQSEMTKLQLSRHISSRINAILRANALDILGKEADTTDTVAALRFIVALNGGALASAAISATACSALLSYCMPFISGDESAENNAIDSMIAEYLNDNQSRWYAMRLRHNVDFGDITKRLEQCRDAVHTPELFYPCQEIAKRIGRRLVYREHPLISDVVFFRSRPSDLTLLFNQISDLAWGYSSRQTDGTFSYSVISRTEMEKFQNAIGIFTPDVNVFPIGTLTPAEGEPVIVIGGPLAGHTGQFDAVTNDKDGSILYRLILPGNNGIEWRASLKPILVKQLNKTI